MGGKLEECWKNLPFLQNQCQPGMKWLESFRRSSVHSNAAIKVFNLSLFYE
jgi:hypothetical protein